MGEGFGMISVVQFLSIYAPVNLQNKLSTPNIIVRQAQTVTDSPIKKQKIEWKKDLPFPRNLEIQAATPHSLGF